jgi:hypothetical protein
VEEAAFGGSEREESRVFKYGSEAKDEQFAIECPPEALWPLPSPRRALPAGQAEAGPALRGGDAHPRFARAAGGARDGGCGGGKRGLFA